MAVARDIVRADVLCLEPQMPIEEAFKLMQQHDTTSAMVLNDDYTPAGILVESDIVRMFIDPDSGGKTGISVKDFMTENLVVRDISSSIDDVSRCLLDHHFEQVPILCNGKFVGIINRKDLLQFMIDSTGE